MSRFLFINFLRLHPPLAPVVVSKEGRLHCLDDFEQSNNTAMLVPNTNQPTRESTVGVLAMMKAPLRPGTRPVGAATLAVEDTSTDGPVRFHAPNPVLERRTGSFTEGLHPPVAPPCRGIHPGHVGQGPVAVDAESRCRAVTNFITYTCKSARRSPTNALRLHRSLLDTVRHERERLPQIFQAEGADRLPPVQPRERDAALHLLLDQVREDDRATTPRAGEADAG